MEIETFFGDDLSNAPHELEVSFLISCFPRKGEVVGVACIFKAVFVSNSLDASVKSIAENVCQGRAGGSPLWQVAIRRCDVVGFTIELNLFRFRFAADQSKDGCNLLGVTKRTEEPLDTLVADGRKKIFEVEVDDEFSSYVGCRVADDGSLDNEAVSGGMDGNDVENVLENPMLSRFQSWHGG